MSINLKLDLTGNTEPPSIILANRNGNRLGQLNVNPESIDIKDKFNSADEFTFTLNKYIDEKITPLWNKVVDFKLVYCPEWDEWFEIKVELDEATETVKTVLCTQLGQAELSQLRLYDIHINEEGDPNWNVDNETYEGTIFYDENNIEISLLHRLLKDKAPHYSIVHVDETLKRIQKTFSFDNTSISEAFNEIAEEVGCLFVYHSNSNKDGFPNRAISVYDLQQNCNNKDCKHRGEFTDKCPKCGSADISYGYGEDTTIFVTSDELATEGIQLVTDTDSVKNCFKLEAGDDLMTATIHNCNPNGSGYIWYFSDAVKEDMSKDLVEAIEEYNKKYQECYNDREYVLDENLVEKYNNLVNKYSEYYNTYSTCLDCGNEDYFEEQCTKCGGKNILAGKIIKPMPITVVGYPNLMTEYYNTIDLSLYLESGLMPNIKMSNTNASEQISLLTTSSLSPVAVNVAKVESISEATAKSAVLSMAKIIIKSTYKVDITSSSLSEQVYSDKNGEYKIWEGQFVVTNYSDENDTDKSELIYVRVNNNAESFIKQKIDKSLNKDNTDDYSITGLFAKEIKLDKNGKHVVDENGDCQCDFCKELKKYALNPLDNFYKSCESCLTILTEQGAGDEDSDLYKDLYKPYYEKSIAIANELKVRENEISIIKGVYEKSENGENEVISDGLQTNISNIQSSIQEELNFEQFLFKKGENANRDLWVELCSYRRDDKYSNNNYISDGLNNAELFERANEFIEVANNEIFKSAELQHSISATLNNLLIMPKFSPLVKHFKTGNWIRVQIDDKVYRLRLIEYGISFGDLNTISVDFSDVTKIKNGMTDVRDVISQASVMASSYDSVQRQAKKGNIARNTVDQWLVDGLNAANVQIHNNDNEEVLLTKNGLLARSYNDITGEYAPEQLKITHNIMAYTDDNWETVKQSIGKHDYKLFDENENRFIDKTGYGMNADFVTAGVVSGSQIIGGNVYSHNYSKTVDENGNVIATTGSYIDLENGTFSFASGKLTYDQNGDKLTIVGEIKVTDSGRIACWDINANAIYKDSDIFGNPNGMYFGKDGLSLSDKFKVSPSGYTEMTDAYITGVINAEQGGTIAGFNIGDKSITNLKNSYDDEYNGVYIGVDGIGLGANGAFYVNDEGYLFAKNAYIEGTITADDGLIGGFTIGEDHIYNGIFGDDNSVFISTTDMEGDSGFFDEDINNWRLTVGSNFGVTSNGSLYANNANISGTINANDGSIGGWNIDNNSLYTTFSNSASRIFLSTGTTYKYTIGGHTDYWYIGAGTNNGNGFGVTTSGVLYANGADISGTINADDGFIGGWTIDDNVIESGSVKLCSSSDTSLPSLANSGSTSYVRINAGDNAVLTHHQINSLPYRSSESYYRVQLQVSSSEIINDTITVTSTTSELIIKGFIPSADGVIDIVYIGGGDADISCEYVKNGVGQFCVLEDGSMYASAIDIKGNIDAVSGKIGNLQIENGGLECYLNGNPQYCLNEYGLRLYKDISRIEVGDLTIGYDTQEKDTILRADGKFIITSGNGTKLEFMKQSSGDSVTSNITLYYQAIEHYATGTEAKIWAKANQAPIHPITIDVKWQNGFKSYTGIISLRIDSGSTTSNTVEFNFVSSMQNRQIRFSHKDGSWSNFVGGSGTSTYTINNFASFSQTSSPNNLYLTGNFIPSVEAKYNLGASDRYWNTIFVRNSAVNLSDRNEKNTISPLSNEYEQIFDSLKSVSYKYNVNNNNRTHLGFVAQDVKEAVEDAGLTTQDFAAYCEWENEDGEVGCGLRYSEFIAMCVDQIQKLKKRVKELENKS